MWGHPSTPYSDPPPPPKLTVNAELTSHHAISERNTHTRYTPLRHFFFPPLILDQDTAAQRNNYLGDICAGLRRNPPTQQLSSNEGEVMSLALRRMVMPNVCPGCYSEPLLSAGLTYFWPHKTRGGDKPQKNLVAFPFEYKCYFTPDVS